MKVSEAVEAFWLDMNSTSQSYKTPLRALIRAHGEDEMDTLTDDTLVGFIRNMRDGVKPSTLNVYISAVHSFAQWAIDEQQANFTYALNRRLSRFRETIHYPTPEYPPDEDVAAIIGAIENEVCHLQLDRLRRLRDLALVHALRATGGRNAEVRGILWEKLIPMQKAVQVVGKGKKFRILIFDDRAWRALVMFREALDAHYPLDVVTDRGPVFRDVKGYKDNAAVDSSTIPAIVRRWSEVAGVEYPYPHKWRRRFVTKVYKKDRDLVHAQKAAGHEDPKTTMRYIGIEMSEVVAAIRETDL